jgi:hypothetical protein
VSGALPSTRRAADNSCMTMLSEPTGGARHRAPEDDDELRIAALADLERSGRHAEPEWARPLFDATTDQDPFDWLGFGQN